MSAILTPDGVVQLSSTPVLIPGGVIQVTTNAYSLACDYGTYTVTGQDATLAYTIAAGAATPTSVGLSGKSTRSTKRGRKGEKLVVIEEIDDVIEEVEEILGQIEEVVKKEPKKKADKPAIKPQDEVNQETVFDWIGYYESMLMRLRDRQRAQALQNRLMMAATMAMQALQRAEAERLAYEAFMLDEEEVAILLAA